MVRKKRLQNGMIICHSIGPIVGLLIGTHFLSSRNKVYVPMIRSRISFLEDEFYINDFDYDKEQFLNSDLEYAYYELKEILDYSEIEELIKDYREKYKSVNYFICLEGTTPYVIRYKELKKFE